MLTSGRHPDRTGFQPRRTSLDEMMSQRHFLQEGGETICHLHEMTLVVDQINDLVSSGYWCT